MYRSCSLLYTWHVWRQTTSNVANYSVCRPPLVVIDQCNVDSDLWTLYMLAVWSLFGMHNPRLVWPERRSAVWGVSAISNSVERPGIISRQKVWLPSGIPRKPPRSASEIASCQCKVHGQRRVERRSFMSDYALLLHISKALSSPVGSGALFADNLKMEGNENSTVQDNVPKSKSGEKGESNWDQLI